MLFGERTYHAERILISICCPLGSVHQMMLVYKTDEAEDAEIE